MAVVIPTGYAQVVYHWENNTGDSNWATVLGCEHTALAANDIFETFLNAYRTNVQPYQDTNLECTYITVKMGPSTGPTPGLSVDFPVGEVGENAMSGAPSNCTMLVRKLSRVGSRVIGMVPSRTMPTSKLVPPMSQQTTLSEPRISPT